MPGPTGPGTGVIPRSWLMPDSLQPDPKDPTLHKLPPQSIEAEESILSAILIDNSTLIDILEILSAEDFYKTAHKLITKTVTPRVLATPAVAPHHPGALRYFKEAGLAN